jgi:hypothetical protein
MSAVPSLKRADSVMVSHLQHAWERAKTEQLDPHLSVEREKRIFSLICMCDPTPQARYGTWLSAWRRRQWRTMGLRFINNCEELENLAAALAHFVAVQPYLPAEHRDIGQFEDAQEVMNATGLVSSTCHRRLRELERRTALEGTEVLFEDKRWRLVRLCSKEAAMWWGKGTRWCTSARTGNQYSRYANEGKLLVLLSPTGKYQLFTGSGEFKGAADDDANFTKVLSTAPHALRHLVSELLRE